MSRLHESLTDPEILAHLGHRLALLRDRQGLTLDEAAASAGMDPATVWRAEKGRNPTLLTLVKLLRTYGRLDDLALLVADPPPSPLDALRATRREEGPR